MSYLGILWPCFPEYGIEMFHIWVFFPPSARRSGVFAIWRGFGLLLVDVRMLPLSTGVHV